ncbi:TetR-like C-terminal domain-containing protein [Bifidobacterium sp. ESL0784]|uniref:TetR/AcrR family transcriptional regulator n=1 Tax=Bifidobacterium sp. ESL0784 TaxID=2983231 RepID=UPI0023F9FBE8|nr:TetR-like C-terminal domain-containing protein [Bifidobacterium sp. ESL0784]MDF7641508.1 TetR-like C-terminal domain-containing protein [Bifidobacterium sp. ESL0784]
MNTVGNKRKQASQEKIENAFTALVREKDVSEISVTEICRKAEVNRSTFYASYTDIKDLMDAIEERMLADFHDLYADEEANGYNSNDFSKLFAHIKEHQDFYRAYFKMGLDLRFQPERYDTNLAEKYYPSGDIAYHRAFFRAGITALIKLWLENGCDLSPDRLFTILKDEYRNKQ